MEDCQDCGEPGVERKYSSGLIGYHCNTCWVDMIMADNVRKRRGV